MQEKLNVWSFVFSLLCLGLCLIISFTGLFRPYFTMSSLFEFLLALSLAVLLAAVIGLYGIRDWKGLVRSVAAFLISVGLIAFTSVILFFGVLLS